MINFAEFQLDSLCLHLRLTVHLSVFSAGKSFQQVIGSLCENCKNFRGFFNAPEMASQFTQNIIKPF